GRSDDRCREDAAVRVDAREKQEVRTDRVEDESEIRRQERVVALLRSDDPVGRRVQQAGHQRGPGSALEVVAGLASASRSRACDRSPEWIRQDLVVVSVLRDDVNDGDAMRTDTL